MRSEFNCKTNFHTPLALLYIGIGEIVLWDGYMKYWPYEETEFAVRDEQKGQFLVSAPWIASEIEVEPGSKNFEALVDFLKDPHPTHKIQDILETLKDLPLMYRLPRTSFFGKDLQELGVMLDRGSPRKLAMALNNPHALLFDDLWTWDLETALEIATIPQTDLVDPLSLLSISRRFHYLDCSKTNIILLYERVNNIVDEVYKTDALALIAWQYLYMTKQFEKIILDVTDISNAVSAEIDCFIQLEKQRNGWLESLISDRNEPRIIHTVEAFISLFEASGKNNLTAFCLALDLFEHPQYRDDKSLITFFDKTNKALNWPPCNQNIGQNLLSYTMPLNSLVAEQAMRIVELMSFAVAQICHELEQRIFGSIKDTERRN